MSDELPNLGDLNRTELLSIIRRHTGLVVKRQVPLERLVELVETGATPKDEELAGTNRTRRSLQDLILKNWDWVNSQLPCTGPHRGQCTIYPCPEGRHLDCYVSNIKQKI